MKSGGKGGDGRMKNEGENREVGRGLRRRLGWDFGTESEKGSEMSLKGRKGKRRWKKEGEEKLEGWESQRERNGREGRNEG